MSVRIETWARTQHIGRWPRRRRLERLVVVNVQERDGIDVVEIEYGALAKMLADLGWKGAPDVEM